MTIPMLQTEPGTAGTPTTPKRLGRDAERELARAGLAALYGADFPLILALDGEEVKGGDWVRWARGLWARHAAGTRKRVHFAIRNRLMQEGKQWVSSSGAEFSGVWREPPKPRDAARVVANMVKPALALRTQTIAEQRPGFRVEPVDNGPLYKKRAQAKQLGLEYQWRQQKMARVIREARFWAGTDGMCVLRTFWNPDAGPWGERLVPAGRGPDGALTFEPQRQPLGELQTKVYRIEQIRVSANATATEKPHYWVLRDTIPTATAVAAYGRRVLLDSDGESVGVAAQEHHSDADTEYAVRRADSVAPDELHTEQATLERFTIDVEPSEFLPEGLQLVTAGEAVVYLGRLPMGVVQNARFADGSESPEFFPPPDMEDWLPHQMAVNAALSKWIESIRRNSDGRFLGRAGVVSQESLISGMATLIEVRGAHDLDDVLRPIPGFSVGGDTKELLAFHVGQLEQKSGWNDTTRGTFSDGESGRSILAQREQVETVFAPSVNAASEAMADWGRINIAGMATYYDEPRSIAVAGKSRPDLGRELSREDFDGIDDVQVDPETLVPLPRAMRLFLLDQARERGDIDAREYRRRLPFAWMRDIDSPDEAQHARAQRVCEAIRQGADPGPIFWQDDEAIHQDALQRELILAEDVDPAVLQAAQQRWDQLALQAMQKMGGMPVAGAGMGGDPAMGGEPGGPATPFPPELAPTAGSNPGVAAAPLALQAGMGAGQMAGASDEDKAAAGFEAMQVQ